MATATSTGSGNWSGAIWSGGSGAGGAPADGDAVVISAGHSVLMDADLSAWTGLTTLTIAGHDSTAPGMLYFKNGTSGFLRFRTGTDYGILGTNNTNKGRLLANSDGVWRGNKGTTVTGSASADTLTAAGHGLANTTPISFFCDSGTDVLPAPLQEGVVYYVRDTAENTFKVAATSGGTAINLTTDGTGTFGVNTCLAYADKAVIQFDGTSYLDGTYLDIALVGFEPINKSVDVYGTAYTCTNQTTEVNTSTDVITFTAAPPAAGTAVMVRSSGTLPGGLTTNDVYYTRAVSGNTCKLALRNTDTQIVDITSTGSGTLTMYSGHTNTSTKVMNIIQDLTADTCWSTTSGHNVVFLVDANAPSNEDYQRDTIASIDTSAPYGITITSANVDSAQYPLAKLLLSSRNVSIRHNAVSTSQIIVNAADGGLFQCEILAAAGQYCYAFSSSNNNTISGNISGCTYGLSSSNNNTISGTISGCSRALSFSNNNTISGTISGCTSGTYSSNNNTISGNISGCTYGLSYSSNNTISGTISGCSSALYFSSNNTISGTISGCSLALSSSNNNTISGTISGCTYGLSSSNNNTISGTISGCSYVSYRSWYNRLRSSDTTAVISTNEAVQLNRLFCENYGRVTGAHKIFDNMGDIIKTACDGTGDAPSVDPDGGHGYCVEASNIQSYCGTIEAGSGYANPLIIIDEQRIWLAAGSYTVTYKVQTTYAGISAGNLKLTGNYENASHVLTNITDAPAISQRSDDTDWSQTLSISPTLTYDGWLNIKIELMEYESGNEVYIWPSPTIT